MANKDDWITWAIGGLAAAILGYAYISSQKAGAGGCSTCGASKEEMESKKEADGGCGCGGSHG